MVEHDFGVAHATVLESRGQLFEAANLRLQEGDIMYAIRLLVKDRQSLASCERAAALVLEDLWRTLSFATGRTERNTQRLKTLFESIHDLGKSMLTPEQQQEVIKLCNHFAKEDTMLILHFTAGCFRSYIHLQPSSTRRPYQLHDWS